MLTQSEKIGVIACLAGGVLAIVVVGSYPLAPAALVGVILVLTKAIVRQRRERSSNP